MNFGHCSRRQFLNILAGLAVLGGWPTAAGAVAAGGGPPLPADFIALNLAAGGFNLRAWLRPGSGDDFLHVFIEGDGQVWQADGLVSLNPTPRQSVSALLAADTPYPQAVLYLARPGQYAALAELKSLSPKWWTSHRYAGPVVEAIGRAIRQIQERTNCTRLGLYGHSGGGALAVLAAPALRPGLLGTVASPLDIELWAQGFSGASLPHSLNPKSVARELRAVRQLHLTGGQDKIVPSQALDSWLEELAPLPPWIKRISVPQADHLGSWLPSWRLNLAAAMMDLNAATSGGG